MEKDTLARWHSAWRQMKIIMIIVVSSANFIEGRQKNHEKIRIIDEVLKF